MNVGKPAPWKFRAQWFANFAHTELPSPVQHVQDVFQHPVFGKHLQSLMMMMAFSAQGHWAGRTHHELWILNQSFPIGSAMGGRRKSFYGFSFLWHKIFRSWIVWIIQETGIGALSMEALSMEANSGRLFHLSSTKMSDDWWVVLWTRLCRRRSTSEPPHRDLEVKCQDSL